MGEKTKKEVLKRGGKLLSAYVSQTNFVQGLDSFQIDMDTLNAAKMSEELFPVVPYEKWSRNGKSVDISVGYKNVPYINRLTQEKALCAEAEKWAKELGYHTAIVESRDNKVHFYETMGYIVDYSQKIIGETFTCYRMEKKL